MQIQENYEEIKIKEYINKYIKELQRHFEISDKRMRKILYKTYRDLCPQSIISKLICILKSFYDIKLKEIFKRIKRCK